MNSVTLSEVEQKYMPVNDTLYERTENSYMDEEDVYLMRDMQERHIDEESMNDREDPSVIQESFRVD